MITKKRLEEYRKNNLQICNDSAFHWNGIANQEGSDFNKFFLTIAILIIPLSFIPLTNERVSVNLSYQFKILIILSWILIIISTIFGAIQQYIFFKFHDDLAIRENKRAKIFSEPIKEWNLGEAINKFNQMSYDSNELSKNSKKRANRLCLCLQIVSLTIGIVLTTYVLSNLLLSMPTPNL